jgi:putative transcriptional regulator
LFRAVYTENVKWALQTEGSKLKNRLEELRRGRGLTQEQLADRMEVSRQTIISLEGGRYNPSILLAMRIAKFFGDPVENVFIYEEEDENEEK